MNSLSNPQPSGGNMPRTLSQQSKPNPPSWQTKIAPWTAPGYHEKIYRNTQAMVHHGKRTRVTASGFGALPYVGENPADIQRQVDMFNAMAVAGKSRKEIWNAMKQIANQSKVAESTFPHPTKPPVIEE